MHVNHFVDVSHDITYEVKDLAKSREICTSGSQKKLTHFGKTR